jgi:hypothetical protein
LLRSANNAGAVSGAGQTGAGGEPVVTRIAASDRTDMQLYRFVRVENSPKDASSSADRADRVSLSSASARTAGAEHDADHAIEVHAEIVAPIDRSSSAQVGTEDIRGQARHVLTYVPRESVTPFIHEAVPALDISYLTAAWARTVGYLLYDDRPKTGSVINKIV